MVTNWVVQTTVVSATRADVVVTGSSLVVGALVVGLVEGSLLLGSTDGWVVDWVGVGVVFRVVGWFVGVVGVAVVGSGTLDVGSLAEVVTASPPSLPGLVLLAPDSEGEAFPVPCRLNKPSNRDWICGKLGLEAWAGVMRRVVSRRERKRRAALGIVRRCMMMDVGEGVKACS